jgi:thiamine transport system substrate-binding protein
VISRRIVTLALGIALVAAACGGDDDATATTATPAAPSDTTASNEVTLVLLTHDSFAVSEGVFEAFTADTGITVEVLAGGDAGAVVNQAILTKDNPLADVLFGIDNTFLSRALDEDLFVPHESPGLSLVPDDLQLDPDHRVTPIDFGDVCVNYDKAALQAAGIEPPASLRDLADVRFAGRLVVQDPATSSPGLAFLLATVATFGEDGDYPWQRFWEDLAANDVLVASGWEEAYYGSFSGGSGEGDRPLVVSYASSPPAEVFFADPPPAEAPTASLLDGCFRQVEFAGILHGTKHAEAAGRLIDFMLSPAFQNDIPLSMFVFPASNEATLPDVFVTHATVSDRPAVISPREIAANRDRWIRAWTDVMR